MEDLIPEFGTILIGLAGLATLIGLWLITKSAKHSELRSCRSCGYDVRTVNNGERCPHCGATLEEANVLSPQGAFSRTSKVILGLLLAIPGSIALMYFILTQV